MDSLLDCRLADYEFLWSWCEHFVSGGSHQNHVLNSHATAAWNVNTWLDGYNHAGFQLLGLTLRQTWGFVDFYPYSMPQRMSEVLVELMPAQDFSRCRIHLVSLSTGVDSRYSRQLRFQHSRVDLPRLAVRTTAAYGSGHV